MCINANDCSEPWPLLLYHHQNKPSTYTQERSNQMGTLSCHESLANRSWLFWNKVSDRRTEISKQLCYHQIHRNVEVWNSIDDWDGMIVLQFYAAKLCAWILWPPWGSAIAFLPLRGEDAVEQSVWGVAALWRLEGEHILENIEGKLFQRLTEQRGFGKGRPLLL